MFTQIRHNRILLLSIGTLTALAAQLWIASPAKAECMFEGTIYGTGETVGPLICMPDGTWQRNS